MAHSETVVFRGMKFRRYPRAKQSAHRNYFWPGGGDRQRGTGALHVEIWKSLHGKVPRGHHVHHRDGNPLNNAPSNLACVSPKAHRQDHFRSPKTLARARVHIARIRPLAAGWHRSREGIAWHSKHWRKILLAFQPAARRCVECRKPFEDGSLGRVGKYCAPACKARARRSSGVDDEQRKCPVCRVTFISSRFSRARCCSRTCGQQLRRQSE